MHHTYHDITDKLGTPLWYDEHAVPRYCKFAPTEVANIYAKQVVLFRIACQGCFKMFAVAESWSSPVQIFGRDLASQILDGSLHYGDPPNAECCGGTTMNCLDLYVIEYWERIDFEWVRNAKYEIELGDAKDYETNKETPKTA